MEEGRKEEEEEEEEGSSHFFSLSHTEWSDSWKLPKNKKKGMVAQAELEEVRDGKLKPLCLPVVISTQ